MFRRWLVALTLVGLVLTGAAMTTHATHAGVAVTDGCPHCDGESLASEHAMLLALGIFRT